MESGVVVLWNILVDVFCLALNGRNITRTGRCGRDRESSNPVFIPHPPVPILLLL